MKLFILGVMITMVASLGCKDVEIGGVANDHLATNKMKDDHPPLPDKEILPPAVIPIATEIALPPLPDKEIFPPAVIPIATEIALPPFFAPGHRRRSGGQRERRRATRVPVIKFVHFVPNSYQFWTDPLFATTHLLEGCRGADCQCTPGEENCQALPAFADIVLEPSNFVWCKGGPYALCYYSGPDDGGLSELSCTLSDDERFADCRCIEIPWGAYFVVINSILNYPIYRETVRVCGADGSRCSGAANVNKAPVCQAINANNLIPGADLISTFSFDCVPTEGLGQTDCPADLYAGCMTAPCQRTSTTGIVECSCPTFNGPYQVGTALDDPAECDLGEDLVWSAAFSPQGQTIPPPSPCIPDAPGGSGCPLYNDTMQVPEGTDCQAICDAYACVNDNGIEPAFTCDATLCTSQCNGRRLLKTACQELADCPAAGLAAIAQLESKVECSCCASQLCGCEPNPKSAQAIFDLNQRQRDLGITPQCDINATLCGSENL